MSRQNSTISPANVRNPNLIGKLSAPLPPAARQLLDNLLRLAHQHGAPAYLVGGPLRDLLLDRPSLDLDITVEADAIDIARRLATSDPQRRDAPQARLGAETGVAATTFEPRVKIHPAFGTATVRTDGFHLDLITARSETYARPGALPTVKPASIREDLLRRDFTINSLALRLNGPQRGEILDPAGGLADLDARLIRALHDRSFQDDATRILRAVRYASRLEFTIEPGTLAWIERDLPYLQTISGARLHHEFSRIFAEEAPEKALRSLHDYGVLAAIHLALRFDPTQAGAFARLRQLNPTGARAAYSPALAWRLSEPETADLGRRLALTKAQRAALEAMPALQDVELSSVAQGPSLEPAPLRDPHLKRSTLVELLSPFPLPALWAFAALSDDPTVRDRLLDYLTKARHERPHLTGDDLIAMGLTPGPAVGEALRRLRAARLDGEVKSRKDEERLAAKLVATAASALPQRHADATTPLPAHPEVSKE